MAKKVIEDQKEQQSASTPLIVPRKAKKKKTFLITLIFVALIGLCIFVFRGKIVGQLKNVPIVGSLFKDSGSKEVTLSYEELAADLALSQAKVTELEEKIRLLESEKEELNSRSEALQEYKENYDEFISQKEKWETQIANENTELFLTQFENIYPETAERIYRQLKSVNLLDKEQKAFSNTIGQMDPEQAAKALENLISSDPTLVKLIFDNMGQEQKASILDNMSSSGASTVFKLISPKINLAGE